MKIKQLPPELANQIAAGEVIERPASIVKELIENAIDANADSIQIEIENGGIERIRIQDNGIGIAKEDLLLALTRHATSKIYSINDLENIQSLGFRGEALASISSVSRLILTSKPKNQNEAWQAYASGTEMNVTIQPTSHPNGTSIEVRNLFYNIPARRRFLRSEKTEFLHINEVVKQFSFNYPQIEFIFSHNKKSIYRFHAENHEDNRISRLKQLINAEFTQDIQKIDEKLLDFSLSGFVNFLTQTNPQQYFFINGRFVRDRIARHAIRQACDFLNKNYATFHYILHLTLPANQIDVNVHPTKHEVRFENSRLIHDFIYKSITSLLQKPTSFYPKIEQNQNEKTEKFNFSTENQQNFTLSPNQKERKTPKNAKYITIYAPEKMIKTNIFSEKAKNFKSNPMFPENHLLKNEMEQLFDSFSSPSFGRVLTVFNNDFALLEQEKNFAILSIKYAQKWVYFYQFQQNQESENLLIPMTFSISKQEFELYSKQMELFEKIHFHFSIQKNTLTFLAVPNIIKNINWQQFLPKLTSFIEKNENQNEQTFFEFFANELMLMNENYTTAKTIQLLAFIEQNSPKLVLSPPNDLLKIVNFQTIVDLFYDEKNEH